MKEFSSNAGFGIAKTGDMYLRIADTSMTNKEYVDFELLEKVFLQKCQNESNLIAELLKLDGVFNIEIVPSFTNSSKPAIIFSKDFFKFVNTIQEKLNIVEIDMYIS